MLLLSYKIFKKISQFRLILFWKLSCACILETNWIFENFYVLSKFHIFIFYLNISKRKHISTSFLNVLRLRVWDSNTWELTPGRYLTELVGIDIKRLSKCLLAKRRFVDYIFKSPEITAFSRPSTISESIIKPSLTCPKFSVTTLEIIYNFSVSIFVLLCKLRLWDFLTKVCLRYPLESTLNDFLTSYAIFLQLVLVVVEAENMSK